MRIEALAETADLGGVLTNAWALLERGARDPASAMHFPVFATRGLDDLPNARTVLLWRTDVARRTLYFHTDVRSPKYVELKRTPWTLLVFYDPTAETQLRIHAHVHESHDDALAHTAWDELPPETRRVFATAQPPGHAASHPISGAPREVSTTSEDEAAGYRNFVLLEARVAHLDWLHFAKTGHRRAAFTWASADDKEPSSTWLYP